MNLLSEFRNQFSLREWLCAMKQGVKELIPAFFTYVPTAHCKTIKGGAKLQYPGGTSDEIYNALKQLKYENRTN